MRLGGKFSRGILARWPIHLTPFALMDIILVSKIILALYLLVVH